MSGRSLEREIVTAAISFCDERIAALTSSPDDVSIARKNLYAEIAEALATTLPTDRKSSLSLAIELAPDWRVSTHPNRMSVPA